MRRIIRDLLAESLSILSTIEIIGQETNFEGLSPEAKKWLMGLIADTLNKATIIGIEGRIKKG